MRILYHHRTQALDGQRVHIRAMQDALRAAGHEVLEVSPIEAAEVAGAQPRRTWRRRLLGGLARLTPSFAYEALELSYNLIGYAQLARAIRNFRPDVLYERYALNTVAGVWASRRFGVPLLLEVNSPLAEEKARLHQLWFPGMARRLEKYILSRATRVLAVTGVLARILAEQVPFAPQQLMVVPNGTRPEEFEISRERREACRKRLGLDGTTVLGAVGFFRDWHGIDLLLQCLHRNPSLRDRARVLLVGEGQGVPRLKELTREWGLTDQVVFAGSVPQDQVPVYVAAMDIVPIPRVVEYASPLKLFEYMAAGKAIVAPRQENLMEVLTEGVDALCFEPEDASGLAEAVRTLVENSELQRRLGEEARRTIQRRELTWEANAARLVEACQSFGCGLPAAVAAR